MSLFERHLIWHFSWTFCRVIYNDVCFSIASVISCVLLLIKRTTEGKYFDKKAVTSPAFALFALSTTGPVVRISGTCSKQEHFRSFWTNSETITLLVHFAVWFLSKSPGSLRISFLIKLIVRAGSSQAWATKTVILIHNGDVYVITTAGVECTSWA